MNQENGPVQASARRVQETLDGLGIHTEVIEFSESTRTSQEAADAVGASVAQIAKSLVFRAGEEFILVIASGKNRVNEKKLKALVGVKIKKAHPDQVREATGYAIGGIPPVGHSTPLRTFIDEELLPIRRFSPRRALPTRSSNSSPTIS